MPRLLLDGDAYSFWTLTKGVNELEYSPRFLQSLDLFTEESVSSPLVAVEETDGSLSLVPTSRRGSPATQGRTGKSRIIPLTVPRLAKEDYIYPDEVIGKREAGTDQPKSISGEITKRQRKLVAEIARTWEHLLLGAVSGVVLDADGSELLDLFEAFNVEQPSAVDFNLDQSAPGIKGKCHGLKRTIVANGRGLVDETTLIIGLAGDEFFDALVQHDEVVKAYEQQVALRQGQALQTFDYAGIRFVNYRGAGSVAVANTECRFFPLAREAFKKFYAPADKIEAVGTDGLPLYSWVREDEDGRWVKVEVQSNPLPICVVPGVLVTGNKT